MVRKSLGYQREANNTGKDLFLQEDENTRTKLESASILLVDVRILFPAAELVRVGGHRGEPAMISCCVASPVDRCQTKMLSKVVVTILDEKDVIAFGTFQNGSNHEFHCRFLMVSIGNSLEKWRSPQNESIFLAKTHFYFQL